MSDSKFDENRLNDLLADKAIFGLNAEETKELSQLISLTDKADDDSFEIAAAAVDLSMSQPEPMPANLSRELSRQGHAAMEEEQAASQPVGESEKATGSNPVSPKDSMAGKVTAGKIREIMAWGCAAAIAFVALMVWNNNRADMKQLQDELASLAEKNKALVSSNAKLEVSVNEYKQQVNPDGKEIYTRLAKQEDVIQWDWSATGDSEGTGEIIWDEENQEGVMRLVNLEVNDPSNSQYQLWIIEEEGRRNPVDGGVFDIKEKGEIFVPVNSKLFAKDAVTFAITVEKPGGVVVSNRENLPLLAVAPKDAD